MNQNIQQNRTQPQEKAKRRQDKKIRHQHNMKKPLANTKQHAPCCICPWQRFFSSSLLLQGHHPDGAQTHQPQSPGSSIN
jgi:hypothetical protein